MLSLMPGPTAAPGVAKGLGLRASRLRDHRPAASQSARYCRRSTASPISAVIGPLDDVVVVALAMRYAACPVPRDVLFDG